MTSEYPRLFHERFPAPKTPGSRPCSPGSAGDEDEVTWLGNVIGDNGNEEGSWDRVQAIGSGALTIQFDDALGIDKRPAQGGRS
jgi:hypothetical protein